MGEGEERSKRVVSLFPGGTEIAFALGAGEDVVGVSHACDHPPEVAERPKATQPRFDPSELPSGEIYRQKVELARRFGSLGRLSETRLWEMRPDVIVIPGPGELPAVSLEGVRAIAEGLNPRPSLVILYPRHLDDVVDDVLRVGFEVGRMAEARELAGSLRRRIDAVEQRAALGVPHSIGFIQWIDPAISGGHWIPQMIETAGGVDVLNTAGFTPSRFDWHTLKRRHPDFLVFACEDVAPAQLEAEIGWLLDDRFWEGVRAVERGRVYVGDPTCFVRPGPRVVDGLEALAGMLHPDLFPRRPDILRRFGD